VVLDTAVMKVTMPWTDALFRGIFCNLLVCVAVWVSFAAKDVAGKVIGMFFPIILFVLCGFEHCVANMYFIPAGLFAKDNYGYALAYISEHGSSALGSLSWGAMLTRNLIPSTIGNIIGGAGMAGVSYWFIYLREGAKKAPARAGSKGKKKR
jgi:formate/nitrite transporter